MNTSALIEYLQDEGRRLETMSRIERDHKQALDLLFRVVDHVDRRTLTGVRMQEAIEDFLKVNDQALPQAGRPESDEN